ncbi:MAG TPA: hypothetical protein VF874_14030 [Mycobacterium sp.]
MTAKTTTWIRRVAAGAVLVAAPAFIALDTAAASNAETSSTSPSYDYSPTPSQTTQYPYAPWYQSFHQRHAAEVQSWYR